MRLGLNIFALLIALTGVIWFLQGMGVLLGSFMTNQPSWEMIGLLFLVIGIGLLVVNNRRRA